MKYVQEFTENKLVMTDNKGNKTPFEYVHAIPEPEAIVALQVEMRQRGDVTAAALSLMVQILDNPRFAAYAGKIEMGHKMDPKFKAAIREEEEKHLKPLFLSTWAKKNKKAGDTDKDAAWDAFISDLRTGGIYGNVKSYSTQYLGYFGKLPCVYDAEGHADKSRLLAVSAMSKLIANAKTDLPSQASQGLAGELVKIAHELTNRTEKTKTGEVATAIAALRSMLHIYEKLQVEEAAAAQRTHELKTTGDVSATAADALKKAAAPRRVKKGDAALV